MNGKNTRRLVSQQKIEEIQLRAGEGRGKNAIFDEIVENVIFFLN